MDELVNLVVKETGISPEEARRAVEVVLNTIKTKLPAPIASYFDAFISSGLAAGTSAAVDEAAAILKGKLGGLFGGS